MRRQRLEKRSREEQESGQVEFTDSTRGCYFYNATIKEPSAVTKCVKARLTFHPESGALEHNLVTLCSNVLKVYALAQNSLELRTHTYFNDKIVDALAVPTARFVQTQVSEGRSRVRTVPDDEEPQEHPDYLFVLTENFHCALLNCSKHSNDIRVISRGNISEKTTGEKREPPYSVFLGPNADFIALMLYENMVKIIPLVRPQPSATQTFTALMTLSNAINVRVRHSEVLSVVPLCAEENSTSFGILYSKVEHSHQQGRHVHRIKRELERHLFDQHKSDLYPTGVKMEFESNTVYKIEALAIGGFLAFDIDNLMFCLPKISDGKEAFHMFTRRLPSPFTVSAICEVDEFDASQNCTKAGSHFMRYLFATETGELFMLAFQLEFLKQLKQTLESGQRVDPSVEQKFLHVEFLASKLASCSALVYLDNSFLFYASQMGDSHILKIWPTHQGDNNQPFISFVQTFQSLAPVADIKLLNPEAKQGQQNELVVVSGINARTHLNLVKQGISLKSFFSLGELLPAYIVQQVFTLPKLNLLLMQIVGYDQLIAFKAAIRYEGVETLVHLEGVEVSRNICYKPGEQILLLQTTTLNEQESSKAEECKEFVEPTSDQVAETKMEVDEVRTEEIVVFASESSLKLLSAGEVGQTVLFEKTPQSTLTSVSLAKRTILTAGVGGTVTCFKITGTAAEAVSLEQTGSYVFGAEISSMCLAQEAGLAYVCLQDAPYYSISVLDVRNGLRVLAVHSLASNLDLPQINKFLENKLVLQGRVFATDSEENPVGEVSGASWNSFNVVCHAARSVTYIHADNTDFLVLGVGTGKLVQINVDLDVIEQLRSYPDKVIDLYSQMETYMRACVQNQEDGPLEDLVFWGVQTSFVGTVAPKLVKLNERVIVACCDKSVVLFKNQDSVEKQYLSCGHLLQIQALASDILVYEDNSGVIQLGGIDGLQRLQISRMLFKKQISKSHLLPHNQSIVSLIEEPDFAYLDERTQDCNAVCLVDRGSFKVSAWFSLKKTEIGNCICYVPSGGVFKNPVLLIGTTFMNVDEQIPSKGRLLMLDPNTLALIQETPIDGSIQAVTLSAKNKYLILGVNNRVQVYFVSQTSQFQAKQTNQNFRLDLQDSKQSGTFIQTIVVLPEPEDSKCTSIVVGDSAGRGIFTFEIKETRQKVMISQSASTHISIWVTCIVPLSSNRFVVFDIDKNLFIFEKELHPTSIAEKFKLQLISSFCIGEQVTAASFGSLKYQNPDATATFNESMVEADDAVKAQQKRKNYMSSQSEELSQPKEGQTSVLFLDDMTEEDLFGSVFATKLLQDPDFVQKVGNQALEDLMRHSEVSIPTKQPLSLVYGTADGRIGTLFQVPPLVHRVMQMLQKAMDSLTNQDLVQFKRSDYRQVKSSVSTVAELAMNLENSPDQQLLRTAVVVDGDFVESLIEQPRPKQLSIIRKFSYATSAKTADEQFANSVVQMLELLRKTH